MKLLGTLIFLLCSNIAFGNNAESAPTHNKVINAISDTQSGDWILNDIIIAKGIVFQNPEAQQKFETAHRNLTAAVITLKEHLASTITIESDLLQSVANSLNESFSIFRELFFLSEISVTSEIIDLKFRQARFRHMQAIIGLNEYIENGDDDIFIKLNQRSSAITLIKTDLPTEWDQEIVAATPSHLSQTDLKFIKTLFSKTPPGSISRHMKAYFTNHLEESKPDNFKGTLASLILHSATGWTIESLQTLPSFLTKETLAEATAIIRKSKSHEVAAKLTELFKN